MDPCCRPSRARTTSAGAVGVALLLLAGPAAAQTEPYPPVDPEDPAPSVECDVRGHTGGATATCTGQGLDPDEQLTAEVTIDDEPVAAGASDVEDDGTARTEIPLDCDQLDGDVVAVTGRSAGPDGSEVNGAAEEDLAAVCRAAVGGEEGERSDGRGDAATGGGRSAGPGGLAFTGQDIGLLLLIGLLLAFAGFGLTRDRGRRTS